MTSDDATGGAEPHEPIAVTAWRLGAKDRKLGRPISSCPWPGDELLLVMYEAAWTREDEDQSRFKNARAQGGRGEGAARQ
jgi:hypothetical protein